MNTHLKGLTITSFGVLLVVPDSLLVRLIGAEPMVTAFWRALVAGLMILLVVLVLQGARGFAAVLKTGRAGLLYVLLMSTTAPGFVLAVTYTSVANVVFIFASIPVFAALFSLVFLGEPIRLRMVWTMAAVLCGLAIIAFGSQGSDIASWKGDLIALYVAAAFAAALTALRRVKEVSMIPALPLAFFAAAMVMGLISSPFAAFPGQWQLFLGHGVFIGAASCLLAIGPRYITSAEVSLLILLESVLAPLLVWAVIGEDPGRWALTGGAVVIGALLASNLVALRGMRKPS